jgi:hypothetical protein
MGTSSAHGAIASHAKGLKPSAVALTTATGARLTVLSTTASTTAVHARTNATRIGASAPRGQDGARHDGEDHRQREQRHRPLAEVRGEPARLVADADVPEAEVENVLEDRSHAPENRPIHAFSVATRLRDRPRW